jgi:hypothetical protein
LLDSGLTRELKTIIAALPDRGIHPRYTIFYERIWNDHC